MDDDRIDIHDNFDDDGAPTKHPFSKLFVRAITLITCVHMFLRQRITPMEDELIRCRTLSFVYTCAEDSEMKSFDDPDKTDIVEYVLHRMMFGSFPLLSLLILMITGPLLTIWPRLSMKLIISPTLMHLLCLFSLFFMFLESTFESFALIYSISNAESSIAAPWSSYLLSSLHTLVLWFYFLNFTVNMQLAEFDCRIAREIAAALGDDDVLADPN